VAIFWTGSPLPTKTIGIFAVAASVTMVMRHYDPTGNLENSGSVFAPHRPFCAPHGHHHDINTQNSPSMGRKHGRRVPLRLSTAN
jgi:hypothetical protein